jgi:2',3'-cyclic-nucleotide 2'-phosphodiesterase/3'-nucleotidase
MMKRIRILATSDVHGTIFPYSYADGKPVHEGFGCLKTCIDSLKDENTLLLDNGDVLEGSALSMYHNRFHPDDIAPVTTAMNDIGYDYVNVGNHDFDYGEEALMMHLQNLKAPCITSNWYFHGRPYGPTCVIRDFDGVKVALFGLVISYIPHWEKKSHIRHSRFKDCIETARKTVDTIRRMEKPDYIICLYHGSLERDPQTGEPTEELNGENQAYEMLRQVHGIDVLIMGHAHRSLSGTLFNTVYTETPHDGREIACIDLYPGTKKIEASILKCDTPADEDLLKHVQKEEDECQNWLDQPLGHSDVDLTVRDSLKDRLDKCQFITFLNQVTMEASGADLAANPLYPHSKGLPQDITVRDLVAAYSMPNTIVVKEMTGALLKEYLEKNAQFFSLKPDGIGINPEYLRPSPRLYNYDMVDGIEYTIDVSMPYGQRIVSLTRNGIPVRDDDIFTCAFNNYRAAGGGNFSMLKQAPVRKEINTSMVEILADYIQSHQPISFQPVHNITVKR